VSASDITGDGIPDIITAAGIGGGPNVRAFDATGNPTTDDIRNVFSGAPNFPGGIFIAASADLNGVAPLRLASGFAPLSDAGTLSPADAGWVFDAALDRLEAAGATADVIEALPGVNIEIRDLSGNRLGASLPGTIRLDSTAAGVGWFVDPTPLTDEEFAPGTLKALDPEAIGRVDLLTVILHELAHQLGGSDFDAGEFPNHLLAETLAPGQRRLPQAEDLDLLFSDADSIGLLFE
jgi:hypothetical protein